jgi:hypothetical protein
VLQIINDVRALMSGQYKKPCRNARILIIRKKQYCRNRLHLKNKNGQTGRCPVPELVEGEDVSVFEKGGKLGEQSLDFESPAVHQCIEQRAAQKHGDN